VRIPPKGLSDVAPHVIELECRVAQGLKVESSSSWPWDRVVARDFAFIAHHPPSSMYRDGHDNNWLLGQFALGIPLAVGFKVGRCSLKPLETHVGNACLQHLKQT